MPSTPPDPPAVVSHDARIAKLRAELKDWEYSFAKAHDGRKPTREETKQDKEIAAKYKEYARLRAGSSSATNPKPSSSTTSTKKASPPQPPASPQRSAAASSLTQTPTKSTINSPWGNDIFESPLSVRRQRLFGRRDQVGPTPQKTGRILGIFDSFIDVESTPPPSAQKQGFALGTPSKINDRVSASPATRGGDDDASPFLTPKKRKLGDMKVGTPSRGGKEDIFATPSALRQWKRPTAVDGETSPHVRRPPPMPKRGLSSMLKELREMENRALDDEEDAMREVEMAAAGLPLPKKKKKQAPIFDEVELPPLPPGAFVEETLQDENEGKDMAVPRVWKKKGLKRQHRRVIMRPVVVKPKTQDATNDDDEMSIPEEIENGEDLDKNPGEQSCSDYEGDDAEDDKDGAGKPAKPKKVAATDKKKTAVVEKDEVAKKARKIQPNSTSHMNFRKLNIKNKNSKGKGGGRFGRRR